MVVRKILGFAAVLGAVSGCSQLSKTKSGSGGAEEIPSAEIVSSEGGVVVAKFDPSSPNAAAVRGAAGSTIAGATVVFKSGSLSTATEVTLQEGADLSDSDVPAVLGFGSDNSVVSAGPAVMLTASSPTEVKIPFDITIPLPASAALQDGKLENLAVIYRAIRSSEDGYMVGLIPLTNLTIAEGSASFATSLFGAYQAVITASLVPEEIKRDGAAPLLSQSERAAKKAANHDPTVQIVTVNDSGSEEPLVAGDDGVYRVSVAAETAMAQMNLAVNDEDKDIVYLFVNDCPAWAECKVFDNLKIGPTIAMTGTPTSSDGGSHVVEILAKDFIGAEVSWKIAIEVTVPVDYPPVAGLKFTEHPASQDAVSCLPYSIATIDENGDVTRPDVESIVFLSAGGGRFHIDSNCTITKAVDQITFGPENGLVKLYYKNKNPQTLQLGVFAPVAWKWEAAALEVTIVPGPSSQLKFSKLEDEVVADLCLPLEVAATDSEGNSRLAGDAVTVAVAADHGSFFTGTDCTSAASGNQVTILAGQGSVEFSYRSTFAPGDAITATAVGPNWTSGAIFVNVKPAAISQIAFTVAPESLKVNVCTMFMVGMRDSFGNASPVPSDTVITMSTNIAAENGGFFADAQCTMPLVSSQFTIPANAVEMKAYVRPLNVTDSPASLSATTTLSIANQTVSVTGLPIMAADP